MTTLPAVYIVGAARTPIGSYLGTFASLPAPRLGAVAIRAAVERAGLTPEDIGEVFMSKVCGSGLQAVVFGTKTVLLGDAQIVIAGGMESMSNVPYYLREARTGYRMGDGKLVDGMIFDGLWDPYNDFHMGQAGELCARELSISREQQDAFAAESYRRARAAVASGAFQEEIVAV